MYWKDYGIDQDAMGIGFNALALAEQMSSGDVITDIQERISRGGTPEDIIVKTPPVVDKYLVGHKLTDYEIAWWGDNLRVGKSLLDFFQILGLEAYMRGEKKIWSSQPNSPAYFYFQASKAYRPTAPKGRKHRGLANGDIIEGWHQLPEHGDHFLLNTSLKDVVTCRNAGFISAAPPSENSIRPILAKAREINARFTRKFVLYDADEAGRREAAKLESILGWTTIFMRNFKDPSDSVEKLGHYEEIHSLLYPLGLSKYRH